MNIKAAIFDADGVVINSLGYFSVQYQKEFSVSNDVMLPFFKGKFQDCLVGKADLKEEVKYFLKDWKWAGTADEFLEYWFKTEHYVDDRILNEIVRLREKGVKCYLGTKQEKYRMEYIKKDMGLEEFFDGVFCSCDIGNKKPDKQYFDAVTFALKEKEGIEPANIIFWDDKKENVDSSIACGWNAYLYEGFDKFKTEVKKLS